MTAGAHPFTVVVGMGRSGIGAARLLAARGRRVSLLESKSTPELEQTAAQLRSERIEVHLATPLVPASFETLGTPPDDVVVSPGIAWDHPTLEALRQRGVPIRGELSVAWEATRSIPWIGITGTNGKTTVTHLVSHLLTQAGIDAPMAGNVGRSAAELVLERQSPGQALPEWMVVELSSYQIEASAELRPRLGLWTTLTPDHLERHGSLDNYRAIKRSLLESSGSRILNADDPDLRAHAASWDQADWVTATPMDQWPQGMEPLLWIAAGLVHSAAGPLFPADCLAMPGNHNRQNLLMAAAVGWKLGLEAAVMESAFRSFPGVPHRLERIRELAGVGWYNDSKATNYDAAEVALAALPGPMVVLAGGQAKQGDPAAWLSALQQKAAAVVLFGAARRSLAGLLESSGYAGTVLELEGLSQAVPKARQLAAEARCRTVLLSPACASFDQYGDFEARGDHFRSLVAALET
ncbi:UDP-N-acetylmuramoyl-L-alanine--D-glutamate ligase [Synechococcus sp. Tobar12-5m-g]|uniref:UDP-N-acetylmuramoyl-L-alanine--D-glutamate ligase n=1 Tax=unclassified Synechococcus TaxID=2626047 RepID=UPI0037D9D224|nr:UDP-N-acetylmuramoyl-L-alanine--D-glutamate ligase [Synechococcus sp. Tobar12-5m-g]MCP9872231.1 UDP-N-acetylmuramoyl-L-alanine--D-glutamate ligase [Synechococcus sp. Cruz CV-v-12]